MINGKHIREFKGIFINTILHQISMIKEVMIRLGWDKDAEYLQELQQRFRNLILNGNNKGGD